MGVQGSPSAGGVPARAGSGGGAWSGLAVGLRIMGMGELSIKLLALIYIRLSFDFLHEDYTFFLLQRHTFSELLVGLLCAAPVEREATETPTPYPSQEAVLPLQEELGRALAFSRTCFNQCS